LLSADRTGLSPVETSVAVFYSISNCQPGLAGVSFGAFLIKQVAEDLAREMPNLSTFVTLSPVPGLMRWLKEEAEEKPDGEAAEVLGVLDELDWSAGESIAAARPRVLALAARYLLEAKRSDGKPRDPVARFHLGNGAELAAAHWPGDSSTNGVASGAG